MLTRELRKLEAAGVVARTTHEGYLSRVDYRLTDTGRRLLPLIDALGDWWTDTLDERRVTPPTLPRQKGGSKRALATAGGPIPFAWPPSSR